MPYSRHLATETIAVDNGWFIPPTKAIAREKVIATAHWLGCAVLLPETRWDSIKSKLEHAAVACSDDPIRAALRRLVIGCAYAVQIHADGRMQLNEELINHANIIDQLIWVPTGNSIQLWNPKKFQPSANSLPPYPMPD